MKKAIFSYGFIHITTREEPILAEMRPEFETVNK